MAHQWLACLLYPLSTCEHGTSPSSSSSNQKHVLKLYCVHWRFDCTACTGPLTATLTSVGTSLPHSKPGGSPCRTWHGQGLIGTKQEWQFMVQQMAVPRCTQAQARCGAPRWSTLQVLAITVPATQTRSHLETSVLCSPTTTCAFEAVAAICSVVKGHCAIMVLNNIMVWVFIRMRILPVGSYQTSGRHSADMWQTSLDVDGCTYDRHWHIYTIQLNVYARPVAYRGQCSCAVTYSVTENTQQQWPLWTCCQGGIPNLSSVCRFA